MKLSGDELDAAHYAVAGFIRHQQLTNRPVPTEVKALFRRLELELSVDGSESDSVREELSVELIDTADAAEILRCVPRNVRHLANDLDGRLVGRTWVFERSVAEAYQEARQDGRSRPSGRAAAG